MPKKDLNQIAANIVALTTGTKVKEKVAKNPAAVLLGRLGGLKGGKARADSLSKARRRAIAKKAASARWKDRKKT
jgi:hypothetical protein